jgi:MoaA/NifB/PqqE/SkfB family radical SAM enzyme
MNEPHDCLICLRPFYSLELNLNGNVSVCCPAWSKGMVGNTRKKSLQEIWNDKPIQRMRQKILDGHWEGICRPSCPLIIKHRLKNPGISHDGPDQRLITEEIISAVRSRQTVLSSGPTWINLANSNICNLKCIMCSRNNDKGDEQLLQKEITQVGQLLPGLRELFLTGNGDPFARPDTRELMLNLDSSLYPELRINLLTNGLLLPRYWDRVQHLNFGFLNISCDAATGQTYEKIRLGGKWQDLLQSFEIVSRSRDRFSHIMINMTVMKENFREIPALVELASRYGFGVGINRVRGKWGDQNFFTSGDNEVLDELRRVIGEARELAGRSDVLFNAASFDDIMAGQRPSTQERYKQQAVDLVRSIYYRLK